MEPEYFQGKHFFSEPNVLATLKTSSTKVARRRATRPQGLTLKTLN